MQEHSISRDQNQTRLGPFPTNLCVIKQTSYCPQINSAKNTIVREHLQKYVRLLFITILVDGNHEESIFIKLTSNTSKHILTNNFLQEKNFIFLQPEEILCIPVKLSPKQTIEINRNKDLMST